MEQRGSLLTSNARKRKISCEYMSCLLLYKYMSWFLNFAFILSDQATKGPFRTVLRTYEGARFNIIRITTCLRCQISRTCSQQEYMFMMYKITHVIIICNLTHLYFMSCVFSTIMRAIDMCCIWHINESAST